MGKIVAQAYRRLVSAAHEEVEVENIVGAVVPTFQKPASGEKGTNLSQAPPLWACADLGAAVGSILGTLVQESQKQECAENWVRNSGHLLRKIGVAAVEVVERSSGPLLEKNAVPAAAEAAVHNHNPAPPQQDHELPAALPLSRPRTADSLAHPPRSGSHLPAEWALKHAADSP